MTPNTPDPIDHILNALAHTAPPTGMEARILNTLELHASNELEPRFRARVHPCRKWVQSVTALAAEVPVAPALFFLTTTAAVLLITLAILHHPKPAIGPIADYLPPTHNPLQMDADEANKQYPIPQLKPPPAAHRLGKTPGPPAPFRCAPTTRVPHVPLLGRGISQPRPALDTPTQLATLVSYPAPPMPLTTQEKLLLRIAHHDAPQALAPLTPAGRAAEQAHDKAAFQDFFPPPVPVDYPTLISQSIPPAPVHGASK